MPLETSLPSSWDKKAANWNRGIHSSKWPHYHYYKTFDIYLIRMLSNCAKVLELGCGTGDSTVNFAPYTDLIFASDFI